ncbi:MAG: tail fiber protein [Burkholderiaceae bacterium]
MADPFVGEVRMFCGNFAPTGWAFCNGQLLPISQNTALFSLLGTNYGGDGRSNFGLPNLQGAFPVHAGASAGPGLSQRLTGETGGSESVALSVAQMPAHGHAMAAVSAATTGTPGGSVSLAPTSNGSALYRAPDGTYLNTSSSDMGASGGGQPHNNLPPYLAVSFIIAMQGIFPPRS